MPWPGWYVLKLMTARTPSGTIMNSKSQQILGVRSSQCALGSGYSVSVKGARPPRFWQTELGKTISLAKCQRDRLSSNRARMAQAAGIRPCSKWHAETGQRPGAASGPHRCISAHCDFCTEPDQPSLAEQGVRCAILQSGLRCFSQMHIPCGHARVTMPKHLGHLERRHAPNNAGRSQTMA
jgi:hypothetical protein